MSYLSRYRCSLSTNATSGAWRRRVSLIVLAGIAIAVHTDNVDADLIHYYPFTSGATDEAGSSDGELLFGATVVDGKLLLDGVDDEVKFNEQLVPTSGSYTVALFAWQTVPQGCFRELLSQGFAGGPGFYIGHSCDRLQVFRISDSWQDTETPFPSDGLPHHYALTVDADADVSWLYIDGAPVVELGFAITTTSGGDATRFGRQYAPFLEHFNGELDEVRIYDHALSDAEIECLSMFTCAEDLDCDGIVGSSDLVTLLGAWGPNPGHPADLDGDGVVGSPDLLMLLGAWGPCPK